MKRFLKRRARPIPPNILLWLVFLVLIVLLGWLVYGQLNKPIEVTDYESCVKAGNPVLESYPQQCVHNGQSFIHPSVNLPVPY